MLAGLEITSETNCSWTTKPNGEKDTDCTDAD